MTAAHRMSVLCETHAIPILMYLSEHGPSVRTDIYCRGGAQYQCAEEAHETGGRRPNPHGRYRQGQAGEPHGHGEDVAERPGDIDELMSGQ